MTHHQQTKAMVDVMQSFLKEGAVLTRQRHKGVSTEINPWYVSHGPVWDWHRCDYKKIEK